MKIHFIRHGPPKFEHGKYIEPNGLELSLAQYSESVVTKRPDLQIPVLETAARSQIAVCSELARARSSAMLVGYTKVVTSPLLNESLLPHPDSLPFRLPWRLVLLIFRIAWLFGYDKNAQGIRKDRNQARKAGNWLANLAKQHGEVVVFGHGIMNRLIAKHLTSIGWSTMTATGKGYWSYRVLSLKSQVNVI